MKNTKNNFFINFSKYGPITDIISVATFENYKESLNLGFIPLETDIKLINDNEIPIRALMGCRGCESLKLIGLVRFIKRKQLVNNYNINHFVNDFFNSQVKTTQSAYQSIDNNLLNDKIIEIINLNSGILLYEVIDVEMIYRNLKSACTEIKFMATNFFLHDMYSRIDIKFPIEGAQLVERIKSMSRLELETLYSKQIYKFFNDVNILSNYQTNEFRSMKTQHISAIEQDPVLKSSKLLKQHQEYLQKSYDSEIQANIISQHAIIIKYVKNYQPNFEINDLIPDDWNIGTEEVIFHGEGNSNINKYKIFLITKDSHSERNNKKQEDDKELISLKAIKESVCKFNPKVIENTCYFNKNISLDDLLFEYSGFKKSYSGFLRFLKGSPSSDNEYINSIIETYQTTNICLYDKEYRIGVKRDDYKCRNYPIEDNIYKEKTYGFNYQKKVKWYFYWYKIKCIWSRNTHSKGITT